METVASGGVPGEELSPAHVNGSLDGANMCVLLPACATGEKPGKLRHRVVDAGKQPQFR